MNVVYSQNIAKTVKVIFNKILVMIKVFHKFEKFAKIPKNLPQSDLVLPMFKNFKIHYFKKIHTGLHLSVLQV